MTQPIYEGKVIRVVKLENRYEVVRHAAAVAILTVRGDGDEDSAAKLAAAKGDDTRWQELLGNFTRLYFDGLAGFLRFKQFGSEEMLREGLLEYIPTKKVVFRIIDNGKLNNGSSEAVIEDDTLYLQTTPDTWDSNIDNVANNLIDIL